jgi:hypothetical protein
MCLLLFFAGGSPAATTTFSFTLDEPCKTSAGVYLPNGTLVRTLWSKVRYYAAGKYSATWDGRDDSGKAVAPGVYQIKLLEHNTEYVWDGAIGNTSAEKSGITVYSGFFFMQDMTISGTNAFFCSGYNEGKFGFRKFLTTDPQHLVSQWLWDIDQFGNINPGPGIATRNWNWTTADTNWVYFACDATYNSTNGQHYGNPGCIVASRVSDNSLVYFTNGTIITNDYGDSFPNGIYVGIQPGLSGLAVQLNSNVLAAAVAPDNKIYLFDKTSGSSLGSISINDPLRMNFAINGNLWVTTSNSVVCYTNMNGTPAAAKIITAGLVKPLAIAANSTNANLILVADGGSSQQVKAFSTNGTLLWTYGLAGGYQTNGPAVQTNKFWFAFIDDKANPPQAFLCFAPDGSFWVGDTGNYRALHFDANRNYLEQIMYQPHAYTAYADPNNPSRVFDQFLEFSVDYAKPLQQSWTLVKNWGANLPSRYLAGGGINDGLIYVTTLTNNRTYALVQNSNYSGHVPSGSPFEICELTTNGLRFTGNIPSLTNSSYGTCYISLAPDGSIRIAKTFSDTWYICPLNGFDASNNPVYNASSLLLSMTTATNDPISQGPTARLTTSITTNDVLICFDSSTHNNFHLGGIKLGTTNWLWRVSPSLNLNGLGNYEISNGVTYAGSDVQTIYRNVVYGYHGEFFRGSGAAGQYMHYYDDGLFVGQFGADNIYQNVSQVPNPAVIGNGYGPSFVKTNGEYYAWNNDEGDHGPQRWHLVNAKNILEQSGSGNLGGAITLTNEAFDFPTGVIGTVGNGAAGLEWKPVSGAGSYNIYYSTNNGGPYNVLAGSTATTNFIAGGLTNGQTYYFVVAVMLAGKGETSSEQFPITPFDTSQNVLRAGFVSEGEQLVVVADLNPAIPASGQPGYLGGEYATGVLNLRERNYYGSGNLENDLNVGANGYVIYDFGGAGSNLSNVLPPFTITLGSGWKDIGHLGRDYKVNGTVNANCVYANLANQINQNGLANGLTANPVGTINISVTDTNFHFLTVFSPDYFSCPREFTLGITSTNGASVQYAISEINGNVGYSHVFQFLFRGNITLWADGTSGKTLPNGSGAIVQALFLDDASLINFPLINPPTNLHATAP